MAGNTGHHVDKNTMNEEYQLDKNFFKAIRLKGRLAPLYFKGGGDKQEETAYEKEFAAILTEKMALHEEHFAPIVKTTWIRLGLNRLFVVRQSRRQPNSLGQQSLD
jgi:hypothetical protein